MKTHLHLALAGVVFGLAACSGAPTCLKNKSYMDAKAFPPMKAPPGLSVPKADPNMRVPRVNGGPVGAYAKAPTDTDSSNSQSRCLTTPPPISSS